MKMTLPLPSTDALAHSEQLRNKMINAIHDNGGAISFDRYMEMALYEPNLGYYRAGTQKFGAAGDFITAPEISSLFSFCLATQCQQILHYLKKGSILEFGAGSGVMARDILLTLSREQALPEFYYILEISADLKERQQHLLAEAVPHFFSNIIWLDTLPEDFNGVILANEVIDAFPVKLFSMENENIFELRVSVQNNEFQWGKELLSATSELIRVSEFKQEGLCSDSYQSEMNCLLLPWLTSLNACLKKGAMIFIDYGFPRREFYHPQRNQGTLMCHYRQHAHTDPFYLPGLQDITAHVDFTAIAEKAASLNLSIAGYNTQAGFLLGCGLLDKLKTQKKDAFLSSRHAINQLTSPAEMGELVKVIALTRNISLPLIGFSQQDLRGRL